jgi:uncharacterized protein YkwD
MKPPSTAPRTASALSSPVQVLFRLGLCLGVFSATAEPVPTSGPTPQAPPPAPPIEQVTPTPAQTTDSHSPKGSTLYSIGQPTDEEQLYLEYLNRMRANPSAEGQRLATTSDPNVTSAYSSFGVDLNLMQAEFSTNPAVPPVAMNAQLTAAARWHSGDMFTNIYQGHYQTVGSQVLDPGGRMTANGYSWSTYGENVYSYADSVFYGHAGFAVDWGPGIGGMQDPAGHRASMLYGGFREVGIGVYDGVNGSVGPQLVTQDFATLLSGAGPLITGVVYYDFNGNGFYDIGEGIGGVTVNTPGSKYYSITADSGGYAIPVTSNGSYNVSFSTAGLNQPMVATVSGLKNLKVDYVPAYSPPVITGPNPAVLNQSNTYTFSVVGGASSYQWRQSQLATYTAVEGAENGVANVSVTIAAGYSVTVGDVVASGNAAFHLAQPVASSQYLMLNPTLRINSGSSLTFAKRLGWASTKQIAKAQVTTDGGATWQDVWSQAGTGTSGDSSFGNVSVPLSAFVGQTVQIRFAYIFTGGSYYNQTSSGVGFYLDNIALSNADQLLNSVVANVATGTSFVFVPTGSTKSVLQVRARINTRTLNWGPELVVLVGAAPPALQVASTPVISGPQVQLDFTVTNFKTGMSFQLWTASDPNGSWTQDNSATLQTLVSGSKYRFNTTSSSAQRFYRVKGSY